MAIKVCDAIMGSGKSSAAINYMNEHPDQKFIYITPYLEEASRIRESCPDLHFKEPSNKLPEYGFKKYQHTLSLIADGENVTSTHNMFLRYSDDMVDRIRERGYTLIIDEAVDVLRPSNISKGDMVLLDKAGWITEENGIIKVSPNFEYRDGVLNDIIALSKGSRLVNIPDKLQGCNYYYWVFSRDIIESFRDVYVLSYLFEAQMMKYYFDLVGVEYEMIGIRMDEEGYHFSDEPDYIPEYTRHLSDMIHIFENDKLNRIGENKHALSATWFKNSANAGKKETLRKNVYNYFMNYNRSKPTNSRLWATFKTAEKLLRGRGYYYNDIAFNIKATNDYRDRDVLAYCVNIYMQPIEKQYLLGCGVEVLEDRYALSVMIQWIWRSAIRDGKEIWIYIPSKRMRTLLEDWIKETEQKYTEIRGI